MKAKISDKIIYIDSNIYLRFYDTASSKLKALLKFLIDIKENIFITEQIRDEISRNKLEVAKKCFSANFEELGIKKFSLPEHFDKHYDKKLSEWNKKRVKIIDQGNTSKKEYSEIVSGILMEIMKSTDNVSIELDKLFKLAKPPSEIEIKSARIRKELGNPPGKSNDPLGDQLSWEQFLTIYDNQEVWILTDDKDFFSEYKRCSYLNPFLYNELKNKIINDSPQIYSFTSLADGIKDFCNKTGCQMESLPSDEEMREIKIEEDEIIRQNVVSSNISSIGYNNETSTLEIEFHSGSVYQYNQVPKEVYIGLLSAGSAGQQFDRYVKKAGYLYTRIG
jgi:hypothetical protein